jgi:hypothetical protein
MNTSFLKNLLGIMIALSIPLALRADNIVFDVQANSVTVTTNGSTSRLGGPGCGFVFMDPNRDCEILLTPPSLGTHPVSNLFEFVAYSEPGDPLDVADSVEVTTGQLPFPPFIFFYDIHFFSAVTTITPCDTVLNGCIGPATGALQTVFTLDWLNDVGAVASTDTISFESGAVPEPSAIPWLLATSAVLGIAVRRRKTSA